MTENPYLPERPPIDPAEWGDDPVTDHDDAELERARAEIAFLKRIIEALIR